MAKAQGLSLNMIIVAAIGLIVLVIVAIIFRVQIVEYARKYMKTANSAIDSAEGKTCTSLFADNVRKCSTEPPGSEWKPVTSDTGKWKDCKKDESCYEKTKASDKESSKNG